MGIQIIYLCAVLQPRLETLYQFMVLKSQVEEHLEKVSSKEKMEGQQTAQDVQISSSLVSVGGDLPDSPCPSSSTHSASQQRLQQKRQTFQKHGQLTQQFQQLNLLPGAGVTFGSTATTQV